MIDFSFIMQDVNNVDSYNPGIELDFLLGSSIGLINDYLPVGFFDTDSETEEQLELAMWMDVAGLTDVGEYFIHTDNMYFIPVDDWTPSSNFNTCAFLIVDYRITISWIEELSGDFRCEAHIDSFSVPQNNKKHEFDYSYQATGTNISEAVNKVVIKYIHNIQGNPT
jgi:hypothetical protein